MKRIIAGFTLVELMIVVGVILLLAGIAIPNLLRARISAIEDSAMASLRTVLAAQTSYRVTHSQYSALANLFDDNPPYIDSVLSGGTKQGYLFTATPVANLEGSQFIATAVPQRPPQARTFYIDEDGVLCRSDAANTAAPTEHEGTNACPSSFTELQ